MLKNYLTVAFRNLQKHLSYSLINIFGLGLGLATALLLLTSIMHELSFDTFNEKKDNLYRVSMEMSFGGQFVNTAVSPTALLPALREFPETETGVRVYNAAMFNPTVVKQGKKLFQEGDFYFADSTFFDVFTYPLLTGNAATALKEPYSVVLTRSTAEKYFGKESPIGKTLEINNARDYTITGVVADPPSNSTLQFDFIASFSSLPQGQDAPVWSSANYHTYVLLHPETNVEALREKTNELVKKTMAEELTQANDYVRFQFMKLADIHLHSRLQHEITPVGDIQYVYIFSGVALIIVLIASINYVNLATARAVERAREVGIRKVVGAERKQLFVQFIGESLIIVLIAFVIAFVAAQLLLPLFNYITGKTIEGTIFYEPSFIGLTFLVLAAITLGSGAYPAFAITAFKPVSILKGNFKFSGKGVWLRKVLVVMQFSISLVLIIGTMVILKQLDFIRNRKLGYNNDNVILLPLDEKTKQAFTTLKSEMMKSGAVSQVGRATESPTEIGGGYGFNLEGDHGEQGVILTAIAADTGFIPTLDIELVQGRNFNHSDFERLKSDTSYAFVVNQALLETMYIDPEKAIGTKANLSGRKGEIVGVVKDFHYTSLHRPIGPLVIFAEEQYNFMLVKPASENVEETLSTLNQVCSSVIPHRPFEYTFMDEEYDQLYRSEQRVASIFSIFASLAIAISCLGLLGLVAFSATQRTKEIGIRKVLGATPPNVVFLITKDYTRLVLIAIAIGIPLAYVMMDSWLENFVYRTEIGIWPLFLAAAICVGIAFLTAAYQAIKVAFIDPATTLRSE